MAASYSCELRHPAVCSYNLPSFGSPPTSLRGSPSKAVDLKPSGTLIGQCALLFAASVDRLSGRSSVFSRERIGKALHHRPLSGHCLELQRSTFVRQSPQLREGLATLFRAFSAQPDPWPQDDEWFTAADQKQASSSKPLSPPDLRKLPGNWRTAILAVGFVSLALVAWFRNLAAAGLVDDTEPLFVEAARQMLLTRDWITPQFNAQPRFDKPALIYWLSAALAKAFGVNKVWAYRLPSALAASLLMWGLVKVVRQFGLPYATEQVLEGNFTSKKGSLISCIVVACAFGLSTEVVVWGSIGVSDMLLTATTGGCLISFFYGYSGSPQGLYKWGYPLSALFMALSVLSKGPVGVVVPVLVCATFLTYTGELLAILRELPLVKGALIVLGVNLPWYLTMVLRHGRMYWATFFGYHNLERFTKGVNHHDGMPFWFPSAVVLGAHLVSPELGS